MNLFTQEVRLFSVLFFQLSLVFIVICVSLFNLSQKKSEEESKVWLSLLFVSFGYIIPNPEQNVRFLHNIASGNPQ